MKRKPKLLPAVAPRNQVVIALLKRQAGGGAHGKTAKAQRRLDKMDMCRVNSFGRDTQDSSPLIKVSSREGISIEGTVKTN